MQFSHTKEKGGKTVQCIVSGTVVGRPAGLP